MLSLLLPAGTTVSEADVAASSADSARFDVFQLGAAVRAGDPVRSLRILAGLNAEGAEPVLALWALVRELRARQGESRDRPAAAGRAAGPAVRTRPPWARLTARAARVDRMAKGLLAGDAWDELALLATELCGLRPLPWPRGG
jgi:DNA polymerase-3 subunit delta